MDPLLDKVFDKLMALSPEELLSKLAKYKNDPFANTLKFLHSAGEESHPPEHSSKEKHHDHQQKRIEPDQEDG